MKVIGAGFGRTGTTSLKAALEELGLGPCYHMIELMAHPEHIPLWQAAVDGKPVNWKELFRDYQSTVDWPACSFYKELMAEYPDAKVLLSVRDPEAWYQSCSKTIYKISQTFPMAQTAELFPFLPIARFGRIARKLIWAQTFAGRFPDKAHALAVFERHVAEVKQYVSPDRLLVYDVKAGWEPLCRFLGVPVPDKPFPRLNDTLQFQQNVRKAQLISGTVLGVSAGLAALAVVGVVRWLRGSSRCA